ncbi:MAG: hypothetical protein CSA39_03635 [Flavobacteriales bacterium]|nr:MAG: hypothetical protein CSA39_03635 [Flavobacteriales bacterium]
MDCSEIEDLPTHLKKQKSRELKLMVLCLYEGFFELHSRATEVEKGKIWVQNGNFLANLKKFKPLQF